LQDRRIKGCSPATVAFYLDTAGAYVRHATSLGIVDTDALQGAVAPFFADQFDRRLSPATVHTRWRGVKTFCRFLLAEGLLSEPVNLPQIRPPTVVIRPLRPEHLYRILRQFDAQTFLGLRNQAIIRLLYDSGLRLRELTNLRTQDVDYEDRFLFVLGKGRKERWVPYGRITAKVLWSYHKRRERVCEGGTDIYFVGRSGMPLGRRGVQMMLRRLGGKLRIPGIRFSAHTFRHSFALAYIENGGDPFSLQRILGHSTAEMTGRYINMARSNVRAQYDKFSPGDRLLP
jgi:site-specific recombinase XerD